MNTQLPESIIPPVDDGRWLRSLKSQVDPDVFADGRRTAEAQRVAEITKSSTSVSTAVADDAGSSQTVVIRRTAAEGFESSCTCTASEDSGGHCQHVVAAALVYLARIGVGRETKPGGGSSEPSGNGDASEIPSALGAAGPSPTKLEDWLGLSATPDGELVYRLSVMPGQSRTWTIDVRHPDAQIKGPIQVKRALAMGAYTAVDERVLGELSAREVRFDSKVILSDAEVADLLDLLRERRIIYRGTQLQFSDAPAQPVVRVSQRDNAATVTVNILLPDGSFVALKDAVVVSGRRTFALVGQTSYALEPDFPPRVIRKWLLEPSMTVDLDRLDETLSFFASRLPRFGLGLHGDGLNVDEATVPTFSCAFEGTAELAQGTLTAWYGKGVSAVVAGTRNHPGYATGTEDGTRKLVLRQLEPERSAAKALHDLNFRVDPSQGRWIATGDAALDFWGKTRKDLPPDWTVHFAGAPPVRVRPRLRPRIRVAMKGTNWFELDASFEADDQAIDLKALRAFLKSGKRFVPLNDGSFAEANRDELQQVSSLLEEAGADVEQRRTKLPLFHATALELLSAFGEVNIEAKARKAIEELRQIDGIPPVQSPQDLHAVLRQYQEHGLAWLSFLFRHGLSGILADDMGLGKTVQALALLLAVKSEHGHAPNLVVAPTSVLPNWEREIERFAPSLTRIAWHGPDRRDNTKKLQSVDVVLTSYALIRRDIDELRKVAFRTVILDEAQNIKNADSATAQACKAVDASHRIALTGTPLENRLGELWSLFDFLMPGFLGTSGQFQERYEVPITMEANTEVRDRLKKRIHPFVLRRIKSDVATDLPPKTEVVTYVEMDPGQAALYREVLEESRTKVFNSIDKVGFARSRISILAALTRLRQVCCDPRLLKFPPDFQAPPSGKFERFGELVDELIREDHRALVFSQFTEMLALLTAQADAKGLKYLYLDGSTRARMARVDAFNDPNGPPLFFISLKAGGTGLNLTAADYVIHYDPWWNPAVEDQATDRTHRIGQTRAVFSYKLITKGTVEERILDLQRRKRELANGVLGTDAGLAKALSEHDLQDLLSFD